MSSFVMIEGFQYCELDSKAKHKVLVWLDEVPIEYEEEIVNDKGEVEYVPEYMYFSDLEEDDIQDHCYMNGYLFDKHGKPIHNLILTQYNIDNKLKESEAN